jgi:hypothetical protein
MGTEAAAPRLRAIEMKASGLRGLAASLRAAGLYEAVLARVPPATQALLTTPPPVTAWVNATHFAAVYDCIHEMRGEATVRRVSRAAIETGVMPLIQPVVQSVLRLFGASPRTILERVEIILGSSTRGVKYAYVSEQACRGQIVMRCPPGVRMSHATLLSTCAAFEIVFDLCGTRGSITPLPDTPDGHAMRVEWQS